ncbi:MAG: thioester dehydrase [Colwellia sp.]
MDNSLPRVFPSINTVVQQHDSVLLGLTINADLKCFKGHFDDVSVVPGVVQLEWAIVFSREYLAMQGDVLDVSVLKFQKLLLPSMEIQLEIIKKSPEKFTFKYFRGDDKFSSARVELSS